MRLLHRSWLPDTGLNEADFRAISEGNARRLLAERAHY